MSLVIHDRAGRHLLADAATVLADAGFAQRAAADAGVPVSEMRDAARAAMRRKPASPGPARHEHRTVGQARRAAPVSPVAERVCRLFPGVR